MRLLEVWLMSDGFEGKKEGWTWDCARLDGMVSSLPFVKPTTRYPCMAILVSWGCGKTRRTLSNYC
jgi:hypothetical protein